jgi:Flp pilus assembly secretin CpaC
MEIEGSGYAIMDTNIQKLSRSLILLMAAVAVAVWSEGCADPFGEKTAALQSDKIIREVGTIKTTPEPNIPKPDIYKAPPKIVEQVVAGKHEWKLFYFCKYHSSEELKTRVHEQFGTTIFVQPDKPPTALPNYTVSSIPATNQLIVRCPTKEDVDAVLEMLQLADVPPVQVKIDCIISEVYADKTLDRATTLAIKNLFGEDIHLIPAGQTFTGSGALSGLLKETQDLPAFPGAALREFGRAKMGLKIGYEETGKFVAMVDLLESKGYLKVLMNPTLEVVNGKSAMVSSSQHVPLQQTYLTALSVPGYSESRTEYIDVVDSLKITPHVFADGYIGLETDILLGSKLTPEGVKQMPIVTKKQIENKENRIRQGESLVIGGIRKTERTNVVRGIPLLKDIPLLGALFSGSDFEERVVETIFILTPTISTGGIPRTEMVEEIKRKHEAPTPPSSTDILGLDAREKDLQKKSSQVEESRLQAEQEKAQARGAVREAIAEAERAQANATAAQARAAAAKAEAEAAKTAANKAIADANAVKTDSEKAKADADTRVKAAEKAKEQPGKVEPDKPKEESDKGEAEKPKEEPGKVEPDEPKEEPGKAQAEKPKEEPREAPAETNKTGA